MRDAATNSAMLSSVAELFPRSLSANPAASSAKTRNAPPSLDIFARLNKILKSRMVCWTRARTRFPAVCFPPLVQNEPDFVAGEQKKGGNRPPAQPQPQPDQPKPDEGKSKEPERVKKPKTKGQLVLAPGGGQARLL